MSLLFEIVCWLFDGLLVLFNCTIFHWFFYDEGEINRDRALYYLSKIDSDSGFVTIIVLFKFKFLTYCYNFYHADAIIILFIILLLASNILCYYYHHDMLVAFSF